MSEARPFQFEDEDTRLMVQAAAGDHTAYERIYGKYHGTVVAYVKARNSRHSPYEDLVQEVFTRGWEQREKYRPTGPVRAYLLGFAKNILLEGRARDRIRVSIEAQTLAALTETACPAAQSEAEAQEQAQAIWNLVARLPARQKQVIESVYLKGLSRSEVSGLLGCSSSAVRAHLSLGLKNLEALARNNRLGE